MFGFSTIKMVVIAGVIFALLGAATTLYMKGAANARQKAEIALLRENLKVTQEHLDKTRLTYKIDADQALEDQITTNALRNRIEELNRYVTQLDNTECLSGADVGELRKLWSPHSQP